MKALQIKQTDQSPKVILDAGNNIFELSGRSLIEDAMDFYKPVFDWLDAYAQSPNPKTNFVMNFEYFNTISSKIILDLLIKLEEISKKNSNVSVLWCFDYSDMLYIGKEFSELVSIPFKFKNVEHKLRNTK